MSPAAAPDERIFKPVPLQAGAARQAFALAQVFNRQLAMPQWLEYMRGFRRSARSDAGLMTMVDRRNYVHAFFSWSARTSLTQERVLEVDDLVIGNLPGRTLPEALVEAFEDLAGTRDCATIALDLPTRGIGAAHRAFFVDCGFSALPAEHTCLTRRRQSRASTAPLAAARCIPLSAAG